MAGFPRIKPYRVKLLCSESDLPSKNSVLTDVFRKMNLPVYKLYEQKNSFIALVTSTELVETLISDEGIANLHAIGLEPIVPPEIKCKRTIVLKDFDREILSLTDQELKDSMMEHVPQNEWLKIMKVIRAGMNRQVLKIELKDAATADRILQRGLFLSHFFIPPTKIEREFFYPVKMCMVCYKFEDHFRCTSDQLLCSECGQNDHIFRDCKNDWKKCLNCKGNHSTTSMACPIRKKIIKEKYLESKKPAAPYSAVTNPQPIAQPPASFVFYLKMQQDLIARQTIFNSSMALAMEANKITPGTFQESLNDLLLANNHPAINIPESVIKRMKIGSPRHSEAPSTDETINQSRLTTPNAGESERREAPPSTDNQLLTETNNTETVEEMPKQKPDTHADGTHAMNLRRQHKPQGPHSGRKTKRKHKN